MTMSDSSIPLTVGEWEEWGNPNEEKYYEYMLSYSPINNVVAQVILQVQYALRNADSVPNSKCLAVFIETKMSMFVPGRKNIRPIVIGES